MARWGVSYARVGSGPLDGSNWLKAARNVDRIFNEELAPVGEAAKGEAQGYIAIAGTARLWSGVFQTARGPRSMSGRGRIDSGALQASVEFRVTHGKGVGLDIGWLRPVPEYMEAQEAGFSAGGFRPSQTVEGMHMFQHLRVYVRGKVDEAVDRAVERILSGI